MATARTRVAAAVADHTLQTGNTKAYAKEVAAFLLSEGRVGELDSLLRDVQADWAARGYVEVLARSVHPLPPEAVQDITAQVKRLYPGARVTVTEIRDTSVLGGVSLSIADTRLDLSIEAKLNKFKQLAKAGKE